MAGDLFQDLPPPTAAQSQQIVHSPINGISQESSPKPPPPSPPAPAPALKSALKRPKPQPEGTSHNFECNLFYYLYLVSLPIWVWVFVILFLCGLSSVFICQDCIFMCVIVLGFCFPFFWWTFGWCFVVSGYFLRISWFCRCWVSHEGDYAFDSYCFDYLMKIKRLMLILAIWNHFRTKQIMFCLSFFFFFCFFFRWLSSIFFMHKT